MQCPGDTVSRTGCDVSLSIASSCYSSDLTVMGTRSLNSGREKKLLAVVLRPLPNTCNFDVNHFCPQIQVSLSTAVCVTSSCALTAVLSFNG